MIWGDVRASRMLRMPGLPGGGRRGAGKSGRGAAGGARPDKSRSAAKGATRRVTKTTERRLAPSVWFNRMLIMIGALVVLAAAVEAYVTLQRIPVQHIVVTGELANTRNEAVQEMVQPALVGGFLNADLGEIREQLEALPWIYRATVRRKWPSALEIHVVEQLPIARWGSDGFLNHQGQVFHSDKHQHWQSLPLLSGPDGSARKLVATYQRLLNLLGPMGLKVEQLSVDSRGEVGAVLAGGVHLQLGGEGFIERMQRFATLYRRELAPRFDQVERVDLRYASGISVAYLPEQQVAELSEN